MSITLDFISDMERYDLMYMKTKELGWKETPRDSKYWHGGLPGEYNSRLEAGAKNLGKL
jgi:hypothetical protein